MRHHAEPGALLRPPTLSGLSEDAPRVPVALRDLPVYLRRLGVFTDADLAHDGLSVTEQFGRNANARVVGRDRSVFVKQIRSDQPADDVARELDVAGAVDNSPKVLAVDADAGVVVYELVEARSLGEIVRASPGAPSPGLMQAAAQALATLPTQPPRATAHRSSGLDWTATVVDPPVGIERELAPATVELISIIQSHPRLAHHIEQAAATGSDDDRFCHGDARFDNLLVLPDGSVAAIDGEASGMGPMLWDLACLVSDALARYVRSIPVLPADDQPVAASRAAIPLADTQAAMAAAAAGFGVDLHHDHRAETLASLCGLRLVQTALEHTRGQTSPTPKAHVVLQFAANILERPGPAARAVLAL